MHVRTCTCLSCKSGCMYMYIYVHGTNMACRNRRGTLRACAFCISKIIWPEKCFHQHRHVHDSCSFILHMHAYVHVHEF